VNPVFVLLPAPLYLYFSPHRLNPPCIVSAGLAKDCIMKFNDMNRAQRAVDYYVQSSSVSYLLSPRD